MKPLKYKEIMPRVAIEKLELLSTDDLLELVGKDPSVIRCALLETSYRDNFLKISPDKTDSISMEEALLENYAQTLNHLIKYSMGNIKGVLLAVVGKFETSNVKTLLRAAKAEMKIDEMVRHIIPVGSLNKEQYRDLLSSSPTVESIVETIASSDFDPIIKEVIVNNKITEGNLLPLELALDKAVYRRIFKSIENLKGLDKLIAKTVLGIEADAINIKIILRFKGTDIHEDQIKKYFLPSFVFNEETLQNALELPDTKSIAEYLFETTDAINNIFYKEIFFQIIEQCKSSLSQLETILERASLKTSLHIIRKYLKYYNIGFILAFLNLKWFEIRNLRCLIVGSERKIAPEQIRRSLVLQNSP
ncbi:hypothetical protein E2P63_05705 [Candidatus Bathyarchaeota archaeon]|nr:hypothetical protein E2P63_05705 [Candidatus Bathyarchaeota archaeon]